MNGNAELLNFVYQNSQMGVDTIKQLLRIVKDENLKKYLESQYKGYEKIHYDAQDALNENGQEEKGISKLDKIKTYMMINMQTMTDKSASHIAEMLIIGSNMGIIDAIKKLKRYTEAKPSIIELMKKLLKFEEDNVQELKQFL